MPKSAHSLGSAILEQPMVDSSGSEIQEMSLDVHSAMELLSTLLARPAFSGIQCHRNKGSFRSFHPPVDE